jgi:hypothetical protein
MGSDCSDIEFYLRVIANSNEGSFDLLYLIKTPYMKNIFLLFLLSPISIFAQWVNYQKMYGDTFYDSSGKGIAQCPDGNYIVVGTSWQPNGNGNEILVMKIEPDGDTIWTRTYGGNGSDAGINVTPKGTGFLIYGSTTSPSGNTDFMSITLDANGDTVSSATYGGSQADDCVEGRGSGVTPEGNYIFAGQTMSYGAGFYDAYIIKTDYTGAILWSRTYGGMYSEQNGNVIQTTDLGFAWFGQTGSFGSGSADMFLVKTDSLGNMLWSRCYGDTFPELGYGITQTSDGGYVLTGMILVSPTNYDIVVIRTDSMGSIIWNKQFHNVWNEWGKGVLEISTGGYLVYGITMNGGNQDLLSMKLDTNGNILWAQSYGLGGNEMIGSAIETADGGFMVCGTGVPTSFSNRNHVFLVKTDSNGSSNCFDTNTLFTSEPNNLVQTNPNPIQGTGCVRMNDTLGLTSGLHVSTLCFTIDVNEEVMETELSLFPSPATDAITILVNGSHSTQGGLIVNSVGQVVKSFRISDEQITIDVTDFAPGIYFCQIVSPEGIVSSRKFTVIE